MSAQLAIAEPRRIKATHRRRRKVAAGHFVQRYYDPQVGRFLSVDPVATDTTSGGNFNRYWYANSNPFRFTDPDGRIASSPQSLLRELSEGYAQKLSEVKTAVRDVFETIYEHTDVRLEVDLALGGGVSFSQSLLHGDGNMSIAPIAIKGTPSTASAGGFVGIMVQPRNGIVIADGVRGATPTPIKADLGVDVKVGDIFSGGISAEVSPAGRTEITPKGGVGYGAVKIYGAVQVAEWNVKED